MLGIDTNVLVRFLVRDDEVQFEKARKLIKREVAAGRRVFVNHLVLMETEWLLRSRYAVREQPSPKGEGFVLRLKPVLSAQGRLKSKSKTNALIICS